jgi:probable F420-dependent oxidoreductase
MKFGLQLPTGREGLSLPTPFYLPGDFLAMAVTAERLGYDSLWGNDHYAPQNYVRRQYDTLPNFYEVLTILSALAAVTERVELGTCVLVLPMREIVSVARQVATLDQVSNGRLLLGVGVGAYNEEVAAARPDLVGKHRGEMLEEGLELLGCLLSQDGVTHAGKYYHTESLDLRPKPVRQPFPILVGGHQKKTLDRVVRYGSGWIPGWRPFEQLADWIKLLREKAAAAGRDPQAVIVAPQFSCLIASRQEVAEQCYMRSAMVQHRISLAHTGRDPNLAMANNLIGTPETVLEKLNALNNYGVDHLAAITFCVNSKSEFSEQVHYFAQEVMIPYRKEHGISQSTGITQG